MPAEIRPGPAALERVISRLRAQPSRTGSIIVTLFGDALLPRGGAAWLGTLTEFCAALGIGAGVVRTAVSRLAADGWLERRRIGRQSQYRLAPQGLETFRTASRQIYAARPPAWTGRFDLAVGQPGTSADLPGFGSLAPLVWLRPSGRVPPPVGDDLLLLSAEADPATARRLAGRAWPLAQTDAAYRRFLESFDPLDRALAESGLDQAHAFVARILLIHDYRRIILRDPLLPPEILPPDWPGEAARALCAGLYRRLLGSSERWLDAQKGPLPPPGPELAERFR